MRCWHVVGELVQFLFSIIRVHTYQQHQSVPARSTLMHKNLRHVSECLDDHVHTHTQVEDYLLHCASMVIRDVCFLSQRRYKINAQSRTLLKWIHTSFSNTASCTVPGRVPAQCTSHGTWPQQCSDTSPCPTVGCNSNTDGSRLTTAQSATQL